MKYQPQTTEGEMVKKDYSKRIIFPLSAFTQKGHLLQIVTIPPKTKQRMHSHQLQTEVYYILEGETVITINGTDYIAKPGDAFITEPGDVHNLWNKTEADFKLLVFKIDMPENSDDTSWHEA